MADTDLDQLTGVGNTTEAKLVENADITSINELANASTDELEEAGIRSAEKILKRAKKMGVTIKSGDEVAEEQKNRNLVETGMDKFDDCLGGGLTPAIIGVSGEHQAGKTQFIFNCLANAAEQTDLPVVYIETEEERFQAERIQAMCDDPKAYGNIYKLEAYSLEQQMIAYEAISDNFDDVALIAVDSFVANFRLSDKFEGRGDLKDRSNEISRHLQALRDLCNDMDTPALIALQVYGNPTQYDSSVPIWGGALMHHTIVYLIHMAQAKGELREAQVKGHPAEGNSEVTVKITEEGMEVM